MFRKLTAVFLCLSIILCVPFLPASADEEKPLPDFSLANEPTETAGEELRLNCKSAILMEETTGEILFSQNAEEALPPASVTKVMTLLLIIEAIDAGQITLSDTVTVSANASSMGGSQIFLKEGGQMTVEDLLKSVVIASANDAAVTLAEYVCGSVQSFVTRMNQRARLLGMLSTTFENVTGLDDTTENHKTSAHDIAIMSRELIKHQKILEYSSLWMDTVRDGAFGLTNTNRLVRFYRGCTGLKTGSTAKAGFCVSVTAKRENLSLICVVMGAETRDIRNQIAAELLDWGFATYELFEAPGEETDPIPLIGGTEKTVCGNYDGFSTVILKNEKGKIEKTVSLPECVNAPITCGTQIGSVTYKINGNIVGEVPIRVQTDIAKISLFELFFRLFAKFLLV